MEATLPINQWEARSFLPPHQSSPPQRSWPRCPRCAFLFDYPEDSPPSECPICYELFPLRCSKCKGRGHKGADCTVLRCYRCGRYGHKQRDCWTPQCHLCGTVGHYRRQCPQQARSGQKPALPRLPASTPTAANGHSQTQVGEAETPAPSNPAPQAPSIQPAEEDWDTKTLIGDGGPDTVDPYPPQMRQRRIRIRCSYCGGEGDQLFRKCILHVDDFWAGTHRAGTLTDDHDLESF